LRAVHLRKGKPFYARRTVATSRAAMINGQGRARRKGTEDPNDGVAPTSSGCSSSASSASRGAQGPRRRRPRRFAEAKANGYDPKIMREILRCGWKRTRGRSGTRARNLSAGARPCVARLPHVHVQAPAHARRASMRRGAPRPARRAARERDRKNMRKCRALDPDAALLQLARHPAGCGSATGLRGDVTALADIRARIDRTIEADRSRGGRRWRRRRSASRVANGSIKLAVGFQSSRACDPRGNRRAVARTRSTTCRWSHRGLRRLRAVTFKPVGPVARAFINDRMFISSIMGPYGSAKTTSCFQKILNVARGRTPGRATACGGSACA
jgi:hypothetical protein